MLRLLGYRRSFDKVSFCRSHLHSPLHISRFSSHSKHNSRNNTSRFLITSAVATLSIGSLAYFVLDSSNGNAFSFDSLHDKFDKRIFQFRQALSDLNPVYATTSSTDFINFYQPSNQIITPSFSSSDPPYVDIRSVDKNATHWQPPSRSELVNSLKASKDLVYDLLIIGGGATGTGCALEAASRGLRVACVERDDFSSGSPS
jgi:hypothetical protein